MTNFGSKKTVINIYELFIIFIVLVSIFNITLLTLGRFSSLNSLILSIVVFFIIYKIFNFSIQIKDNRFGFLVLPIILIALVLRVPGYLYILGGQDQGTYVLMSKQYEMQGSLYYHDYFRDSLSPEQKTIYDKHMPYLLPGFQQWGPDRSHYIMKLYPLHPSWMAIFGTLLGSDNRIYSLTFFSLISLISFYLLAYEISGRNKRVGYIALLLLSLNPIHSFFSKFPVTEVVSLAFTLSSFYFLAKYINDYRKGLNNYFDLILSLLLINGFFYTRMSGFLYIPFYYFLAICSLVYLKDKKLINILFSYLVAVITTFCISYIFYRIFLPPLFYEIYKSHIQQYLGNNSDLKFIFILAVLFILLLSLKHFIFKRIEKYYQKIFATCCMCIVLIFSIITTLQSIELFRQDVKSSTGYAVNINNFFQYVSFLKNLTIYQYINAISIFLTAALFLYIIIFLTKPSDNMFITTLLYVFLSYFLLGYAFKANFFLYNYYQSRYLLSEIIPLSLLIGAVLIQKLWNSNRAFFRLFSQLLLITILLYYLIFSCIQLLGTEMANISSYKSINDIVKKDDLLLVNKSYQSGNAMTAPLKYYFNKNIILFDNPVLDIKYYLANFSSASSGSVYLLTDLDYATNSEVIQKYYYRIIYSYFSNGVACTEHAYGYLPLLNTTGIASNNKVTCLTLPKLFNQVYKDIFFYKIK